LLEGAPQMEARFYLRSQVVIHWVIAALILCQYLFAEAMEEAWRAWRQGGDAATEVSTGATLHMVFGLTVLALAVVRLGIRLARGAPPIPPSHPLPLRVLGYGTHLALYVFLFLMPVSGAAAWFGGVAQAAFTHVMAKNVLLAFLALHVLGAAAEVLYFRRPAARQMLSLGALR
jgi:cytochrome b561